MTGPSATMNERSIAETMPHLDHQNLIESWQERAGHDSELQHQGVIASLVSVCVDSLSCLLRWDGTGTNALSRKGCKSLRRCLSVLRLWANGYSALTGELDALLDRSKSIRQTMLAVLYPLCKTLAKALQKHAMNTDESSIAEKLISTSVELCDQTRYLLTDACDSSSESDSENDTSTSDGEHDAKSEHYVRSIKTYTSCLLDLSAALDCPALEPRHEDIPGLVTLEPRSADGYYTELIRAKFPQAEIPLLQRLGEASWNRYQRLQKEREVNAQESSMLMYGAKSENGRSEFQDSGLGTSLPQTPSAYAETIVSFATSISGGQRLNLPPLPAEAKQGLPFECNACGRHIRAANNREWKRHLYADLLPYTCFFQDCSFLREPFSSLRLWGDHLELEHGFGPDWQSVECSLCCETTPDGRSLTLAHFSRHMEDIALASLPRDVESDAGTESDTSSPSVSLSESDSASITHYQQTEKTGADSSILEPAWDHLGYRLSHKDNLLASNVSGLPPKTDNEEEGTSTVRCICGVTSNDGIAIQCQKCDTFQHIECYYETNENIPATHECTECTPRLLNTMRAADKQRDQRGLLESSMNPNGPKGLAAAKQGDRTYSCSEDGSDDVPLAPYGSFHPLEDLEVEKHALHELGWRSGAQHMGSETPLEQAKRRAAARDALQELGWGSGAQQMGSETPLDTKKQYLGMAGSENWSTEQAARDAAASDADAKRKRVDHTMSTKVSDLMRPLTPSYDYWKGEASGSLPGADAVSSSAFELFDLPKPVISRPTHTSDRYPPFDPEFLPRPINWASDSEGHPSVPPLSDMGGWNLPNTTSSKPEAEDLHVIEQAISISDPGPTSSGFLTPQQLTGVGSRPYLPCDEPDCKATFSGANRMRNRREHNRVHHHPLKKLELLCQSCQKTFYSCECAYKHYKRRHLDLVDWKLGEAAGMEGRQEQLPGSEVLSAQAMIQAEIESEANLNGAVYHKLHNW